MRRCITAKFSVLFLIISIICLSMVIPNTASGKITEKTIMSIPYAGPVGGLGIPSVEGNILSIRVVGTTEFDLVVMTNESLSHFINNNGTYDYVRSLTRFNVTSAAVQGELPPGYYNAWVIAHAAGNFTFEYHYDPPSQKYGLLLIGVLVVGAISIGLAAWFVNIKKRP